jgi:hypothetical protein
MAGLGFAQPPAQPVFRQRELASPRKAGSRAVPDSPPGLRERYGEIIPGRSLLVYETASLPGASFEQQMDVAGAPALAWRALLATPEFQRDFDPLLQKWTGATAPLQLLAVVNRMDLAEWDPGTKRWNRAEMRLIYGANFDQGTAPAKLTVIVEYVHRPLTWTEFRSLAQDWTNLSRTKESLPTQLAALLDQLKPGGKYAAASARLRSNSRLDRDWILLQFVPECQAWRQALLAEQLDGICVTSKVGKCARFYDLWDLLATSTTVSRLTLPDNILAMKSVYTENSLLQIIGRPEVRPRRILSLQQCSSCHAKETGTRFQHVENRRVADPLAVLSKFLSGQQIDAGFDAVYGGDPAVYWQTTPVAGEQPRLFHDVGRRRLFLAAVLRSGEAYNDTDRAWIESFATDFAH